MVKKIAILSVALLTLSMVICAIFLTTSIMTSNARQINCQCNAVAPAEKGEVVECEESRSGEIPSSNSVNPTQNIWASVTIAADNTRVPSRIRACLDLQSRVPYQLPALRNLNSSPAARCANELLTAPGIPLGSEAEWNDLVALNRRIIYQASKLATSGRCVLDPAHVPQGAGSCRGTSVTDPVPAPTPLLIPEALAEQALCGQLVTRPAASPGDLVFWRYRDYVIPTRTAIVIRPASGPADPGSVLTLDERGRVGVEPMPTNLDVLVKRVLPASR